MRKILIENFRHIRRLEFVIPWKSGNVYLLTGANGAGKSTVLSCLSRIGNASAFDTFFKQNIVFREIPESDIFSEATICFTADAGELSFRRRNQVWSSGIPLSEEKRIFDSFGYPEVLFAGAKEKNPRISSEVFSLSEIRDVEGKLKSAVQDIFDDDKFDTLKVVTHGGDDIFIVQETIRGKQYYFSENNFSSGERCVLKLLQSLNRLADGSLVLIDESEMALHPKAQRRLMTYLEKIAAEKYFTVIISTHSATLIKTTSPKRLLFLENEGDGVLFCRNNVYPAAILGEMAIAEEILPDTVFLVEDQEAAMLLEAIINRLKTTVDQDFPYSKILPVGGYMQVVILLDNLSKVFPPFVKRRAVLDRDAEPMIRKAGSDVSRPHFDVVSRNIDRIYYLPCAPEQGVIRLLEMDPKRHSRGLAEALECPAFRLLDVMRGDRRYFSVTGSTRSDCKEKLSAVVDHLQRITGEPEYNIRKKIYRYYIEKNYANIGDLKEDYCSLLFKR